MGKAAKIKRLNAKREKHKAKAARFEGQVFALEKLPQMLAAADGWIDIPVFDTGKDRPVQGLFDGGQGKTVLSRASAHARRRSRFQFTDPQLRAGLTPEGLQVWREARRLGYPVMVGAYEANWTGGPEPNRRLVVCLRVQEDRRPPAPAPLVKRSAAPELATLVFGLGAMAALLTWLSLR